MAGTATSIPEGPDGETSFRIDASDRHHAEAARTFEARGTGGDLVTTDYVVVETWCLLRARMGRPVAMQFWDAMTTGVVRVLGVASGDFVRARQIAREWPDQAFSLVDCTSFAVMERMRIEEAFAFDAHFRVYRLGSRRQIAFHIVP